MAALDLGQRIDAQHAIDSILSAWAASRSAATAAELLLTAGIPAAALARYVDLVKSPHLAAREFWDRHGAGVLPGLPWRTSFGRTTGAAPKLGADCDQVLSSVLGLSQDRIADLRTSGALG
jgi:crotonobetainyl-CoA:carnitine CoA-transferase CaiB-like acyl-CoA transferase